MLVDKWEQITLGELGEFRNGVNFNKNKKGQGIGLINVKDLFTDSPYVNLDALDFVDLADQRGIENYFVKSGDLFFSRSSVKRDGVGIVRMASKSCNDVVHCGFVIRFRLTNDQATPLFLTYLFRTEYYRQVIIGISGGAAIFNVSQDTLKRLSISLPSKDIQEKIASVLFAYDNLIENNTRRIQILEEMCKRIYREWFVDFRFPGHEKINFINSDLGKIPERWQVTAVGNVIDSIESGSRPKGGIDPNETGIPSIGAENILGLGQYEFDKEKYVSKIFFDGMRRGVIKSGDVLLYKDGAKIGRKSMFRDGFPHEICCINEHAFILRTNESCSQNYLYFYLDRPDITQKIIGLNANAAQPGINQPGVKGLPILLPDKKLMDLFDEQAEPLLALLFNLAKKNKILRTKRDILLPRLISGEIDVSEMDIVIQEQENGA